MLYTKVFEITCRDPVMDERYPDGPCIHVSIESRWEEKKKRKKKKKKKEEVYYWLPRTPHLPPP